MIRLWLSVLALAVVLALAPTASADTVLSVGTGWEEFSFLQTGSPWVVSFVDNTPIAFDLDTTVPVILEVTDVEAPIDQFEVYINEIDSGPTSAPSNADVWNTDPNVCFNDPSGNWSRGTWDLPAGDYVITGVAIASPSGSGNAYIQAIPTPEPVSMIFFGTGLVAISGYISRRRMARKA